MFSLDSSSYECILKRSSIWFNANPSYPSRSMQDGVYSVELFDSCDPPLNSSDLLSINERLVYEGLASGLTVRNVSQETRTFDDSNQSICFCSVLSSCQVYRTKSIMVGPLEVSSVAYVRAADNLIFRMEMFRKLVLLLNVYKQFILLALLFVQKLFSWYAFDSSGKLVSRCRTIFRQQRQIPATRNNHRACFHLSNKLQQVMKVWLTQRKPPRRRR